MAGIEPKVTGSPIFEIRIGIKPGEQRSVPTRISAS